MVSPTTYIIYCWICIYICLAHQIQPGSDNQEGDAANNDDEDKDDRDEDEDEDEDEDGFGGAVSGPEVLACVDLAKTIGKLCFSRFKIQYSCW